MEYLKGEREQEAIRWLNEAFEVAKKALCLKTKCGAVIVKDGMIIGSGYNAPPRDDEKNRVCGIEFGEGKPKYDKTCCLHAEWRAVFDALRNNPDKINGSKIYFTRTHPDGMMRTSSPRCTVCSRLVFDAGIDAYVLRGDQGICEYTTDEFNRLSYEYVHPK